jgi:hypothetical protein
VMGVPPEANELEIQVFQLSFKLQNDSPRAPDKKPNLRQIRSIA